MIDGLPRSGDPGDPNNDCIMAGLFIKSPIMLISDMVKFVPTDAVNGNSPVVTSLISLP